MPRKQRRKRRLRQARTSANVLLLSAMNFADMADVYVIERRRPSDFAVVSILGRAIEIALKSLLRVRGVGADDLKKKYSHKLELLYADVLAAYPHCIRIRLSLRRKAHMQLLNDLHKKRTLEYPEVGAYRLPSPALVRGLLKELIALGCDELGRYGGYLRPVLPGHHAARGILIPPEAPYGNASRKRTLQAQIRAFERALRES